MESEWFSSILQNGREGGLRSCNNQVPLIKIKEKKDICLDITKFAKACVYHNINYKEYIVKALDILQPEYFHISGGDASSPIDEHGNLWEGTIDCKWVKGVLEDYAKEKDIYLVFENPKAKNGLDNDIRNMTYFKQSNEK